MASEYRGTYRPLELRCNPINKTNQKAAIKHGGMLESHHVKTSFELMV